MDRKLFYQEKSSFLFHVTNFCWFIIEKFTFPLIKQPAFNGLKKRKGMESMIENKKPVDILRFEISAEKMNELLAQRQICATDVRCLDINSKQCLKRLCLKTCLYNLNSQHRVTRTPSTPKESI